MFTTGCPQPTISSSFQTRTVISKIRCFHLAAVVFWSIIATGLQPSALQTGEFGVWVSATVVAIGAIASIAGIAVNAAVRDSVTSRSPAAIAVTDAKVVVSPLAPTSAAAERLAASSAVPARMAHVLAALGPGAVAVDAQ